jgi:hypothetical protein
MNYIKPIKDLLDEHMHEHCVMFMRIGVHHESPRYYNFNNFDRDTKELTIQSTQKKLGFKIPTDFDFVFADKFWPQFKAYRTEFLINNYPTIKTV